MKTNKLVLLLLIASFFTSHPFPAFAQVTILADSTHTFDISDCILRTSENKTRFYFRTDYSLTSPSCASFFRESAFDSTRMVFDGTFKDYRYDSLLLAEGSYKDGVLDGPLVVRYMNGNIWQKGTFDEGIMIGSWEYFYPDGKPMYSFILRDDKLYVQNVWDVYGSLVVEGGTGNAVIYHYNILSTDNFREAIDWRGRFKNGLMDGRWKRYQYNSATKLNQVYVKGKFVKGYAANQYYDAVSYFGLGQELSLVNAERLKVGECDVNPTNATLPQYPKGWYEFKRDVYTKLDSIPEFKLITGDIVLAFDVDTDGNLSGFNELSNTGYERYLINVLDGLGKWAPASNDSKVILLSIKLTFPYQNKIEREREGIRSSKKRPSIQDEISESWNYGPKSYEKDPWQRPFKM